MQGKINGVVSRRSLKDPNIKIHGFIAMVALHALPSFAWHFY